jgi:hypothetical protein
VGSNAEGEGDCEGDGAGGAVGSNAEGEGDCEGGGAGGGVGNNAEGEGNDPLHNCRNVAS